MNTRKGKGQKKSERGYTLLEYCAGAALILAVVWVALSALGANLETLIGNISGWAANRSTEITAPASFGANPRP